MLPEVIRRSLKVSLIIGTLLVLINQGDYVLTGEWPPVWKIILTYLVPYGVASYAAACTALERPMGPEVEANDGDKL